MKLTEIQGRAIHEWNYIDRAPNIPARLNSLSPCAHNELAPVALAM
jgi:hypothetical protein